MRFWLFVYLMFAAVPLVAERLCLTLERAEELALANNRELNAVRQLVCEGNWDRLALCSEWWPQLHWTSYAARSQKPFVLTAITGAEAQRSFYTNGFTLRQRLFDPVLFFTVRAGCLEYQQIKLGLTAAVNDLIFAVRTHYYLLLADEAEIATQLEHITLLTQAMEEEERKFEVGHATIFHLNETKVAVANALPAYYRALKRVKEDRDNLAVLLGIDPDCADQIELCSDEIPLLTVPLLADKLSQPGSEIPPDELFEAMRNEGVPPDWGEFCTTAPFSEDEILQWEQLALSYRPDVLLQINQWQTSNEFVKKRRAKFLPTATFVFQEAAPGTGRLSPGTPSNTPWQPHYSWGAFLDFEWDLFTGFAHARRLRAAKAGRCRAVYKYQKSIQEAKVAVRGAFYEMEEALNSHLSASQSVRLAEQAIEVAQNRLDVGVITSLNYREVVDDLARARTTEVYSRYHLLRSYYLLLQATGVEAARYESMCSGWMRR